MQQNPQQKAGAWQIRLNKLKTYFSKPQNVVLLLMGIVLTITTVAPIVAIVRDTFVIHPGTIDEHLTGMSSGYSAINYVDLFTSRLAKANLWTPLLNTVLLSVMSCVISILFGGVFAFLITRTNMKFRKYLSSIFIFPYIMPQWTLAVVWQNLFNSNLITGTSNGLLASVFNITMPIWWCKGLFPSAVVLGLHYAPFAYILIGGIFRNMDANLEEAATILDTPRWKTMFRVTLPMIKPAILSTILLVFGSAMGSYPVPHYLGLATLSTKYVSLNSKYTGEASILAILMMIFGVAILLLNQISVKSRKSYTTVTGKSGQISKFNLGRSGKYIIAIILIIITFFTSMFPIVSFAFETFLPNPGDYSFLYTGDPDNLTTKWWVTNENITENGMYGQQGILYQRHDMACLQGNHNGIRMLRADCRHNRHADRLCGIQEPPQQVGELREQHGVSAIPYAFHSGWRRLLHPVSQQKYAEPLQHLRPPHHRRHRQSTYPFASRSSLNSSAPARAAR